LALAVPVVVVAMCVLVSAPAAQAGNIVECPSSRVACSAPPTDFCPGDLNPGSQEYGTECNVAPSAPVDACPDALNPGNQATGTVCVVATPAPTPTPTPTQAAATPDTPVVEVEHEPMLGNAPMVTDLPDSAEVTSQVADVAGVDADAAGAGTNGGGTAGVGGTATDVGGTTATPSGALPYTGLGLGATFAIGMLALLLGALAHASALRVTRRRVATISAG